VNTEPMDLDFESGLSFPSSDHLPQGVLMLHPLFFFFLITRGQFVVSQAALCPVSAVHSVFLWLTSLVILSLSIFFCDLSRTKQVEDEGSDDGFS
jgi:hypothetical protein